jgi:hypothetical protein
MSPATFEHIRALLIDLDGVLYVEEELIPGAAEAVRRFREGGLTLRLSPTRPRTLASEPSRSSGVCDQGSDARSWSPRRRSPSNTVCGVATGASRS